MAILNFDFNTPMYVDVFPRKLKLECNDNLNTITTTGYLNQFSKYLLPTDLIDIAYINNQANTFKVNIANNEVTLSLQSGGVTTPVVDGNFATFDGDTGTIKDSGYVPSSASANRVVMTNFSVSPGYVPAFADNQGSLTNTSIKGARVLQSQFDNPDSNINVVSQSVAVTAGGLNSGPIVLFPGVTGKQYSMFQISMDGAIGVNFDNVGDRNIEVTDGTNIWTVVVGTTLKALSNAYWGDQTNNIPIGTGTGISTRSVSGQPIVIKYNGGTANYTIGVCQFTVTMFRIA